MVGAPRTTHLTGVAGTHDATPPRMGMRGEANSSRKAVLRCGQRKRKHDASSTHLLHLGGLCVNLVTCCFDGSQSTSGTPELGSVAHLWRKASTKRKPE